VGHTAKASDAALAEKRPALKGSPAAGIRGVRPLARSPTTGYAAFLAGCLTADEQNCFQIGEYRSNRTFQSLLSFRIRSRTIAAATTMAGGDG